MSSMVIVSLSLQQLLSEPSLLFTIVHQHLPYGMTPIQPQIFRFDPAVQGVQLDEFIKIFQIILIFQLPHEPPAVDFEPLVEALRSYNFPSILTESLTEIVKVVEKVDFSPMPLAPRVLMIQSSNLSSVAMETIRNLLLNVETPSILIDVLIEIIAVLQTRDLSTLLTEPSAIHIVESSNFLDWPMEELQRIVVSLASLDGTNLMTMMLQVLSKFDPIPDTNNSPEKD